MNHPIAAAALLLVSTLARCGGSSPPAVVEIPAPITGERSLQTEDYLDQAVLPGGVFRWTPSLGSAVIDIPIEVFDADGELPARFLADGMTPAEIESQVRAVVALWAAEAGQAGVTLRPEFAFHSKGQDLSADPRAKVKVRFRSPATGAFEGMASLLVWSTAPNIVLSAEIEITAPVLAEPISLSGYRALLAHEFGHAFGLIAEAPASGHSPNGNDVMYPLAQWSTLSDGDRLAIQELYRRTPDLVRQGTNLPAMQDQEGEVLEAFRHRCSPH